MTGASVDHMGLAQFTLSSRSCPRCSCCTRAPSGALRIFFSYSPSALGTVEASTSRFSVASEFLHKFRYYRLLTVLHRFERELEALRKELAEVNARSERSSPTLGPQSDDDLSNSAGSPRVLSPVVSAVDPQDNIPPINGDAR